MCPYFFILSDDRMPPNDDTLIAYEWQITSPQRMLSDGLFGCQGDWGVEHSTCCGCEQYMATVLASASILG